MSDTLDSEILEAMADSRRRRICEVLSSGDEELLPLEDLAERVAAVEDDRRGPSGPDQVRTVTVELHHVHLPKLEDVGLLEYDHGVRTVRYDGDPVVEAIAGGDLFAHPVRNSSNPK